MNPSVLARAKDAIDAPLRAAVESLDPNLAMPAAYHLGWLHADGSPAAHDSGKGVRPALVVLGAEAAGAQVDAAVPGAVAVELIHNFSLIHDDIMDNDLIRRHRRTVWDVFGVGDAIIVGDALHALAFHVLCEPGSLAGFTAAGRLVQATSAMIAGQAQDVALDRAERAGLDDCIAMESNKTGALLAQAPAIGAVLGGGGPELTAALERFGMALGIAFQAVDDVLGIWGDPARTGKAVGNDLREKKKSMPIAIALDAGGSLEAQVLEVFSGPIDDTQVTSLTTALNQAGIRGQVEALADRYLSNAIAALDTVTLPEPTRAELAELAHFITSRDL